MLFYRLVHKATSLMQADAYGRRSQTHWEIMSCSRVCELWLVLLRPCLPPQFK